MDIHIFEQYLAAQKKISSVTKQAYMQDLHDFFVLLGQKNKRIAQISPADISHYLQLLFNQTMSHAYGVRKLAALKLLCKSIQEDQGTLLLPEITQLKIARFPVFCSESHLEQVLRLYDHQAIDPQATDRDTYSAARNKLILILLYRYHLTINQLSHALTANTLHNTRSALIRFSDATAPIELTHQDHLLLIEYSQLAQQQGLFPASNYLFPVKQGTELKPISTQALWSLVKKLCIHTRISADEQLPVFTDNLEQAKQRAIYLQKHPRP